MSRIIEKSRQMALKSHNAIVSLYKRGLTTQRTTYALEDLSVLEIKIEEISCIVHNARSLTRGATSRIGANMDR